MEVSSIPPLDKPAEMSIDPAPEPVVEEGFNIDAGASEGVKPTPITVQKRSSKIRYGAEPFTDMTPDEINSMLSEGN